MLKLARRAKGHFVTLIEIRVHLKLHVGSILDMSVLGMGLIRAAAILAIDNRFHSLSLKLKCLGMSFGAQKQTFSIPQDSTWLPCDLGLYPYT